MHFYKIIIILVIVCVTLSHSRSVFNPILDIIDLLERFLHGSADFSPGRSKTPDPIPKQTTVRSFFNNNSILSHSSCAV